MAAEDKLKMCGCLVTEVCDHYESPGVLKRCPSCAALRGEVSALQAALSRYREAVEWACSVRDERALWDNTLDMGKVPTFNVDRFIKELKRMAGREG